MRPTNSSTGPSAGPTWGSAARAPARSPGEKKAWIDPGRHDLDAGGVGAVEALELGRLGRAVGQDDVGAADDLGLGVDPALRLGVAGLGLDPGEGVERRHQRQVELVLEPVAGHARQPVVGVQGLDAVERRADRSPGARARRR